MIRDRAVKSLGSGVAGMRLLRNAWLVGVVLLAGAVHADDGAIEMSGGAIVPLREHATVRMVAEFVHAWAWRDSVRVEAVFFLQNTGPRTSVLTGFPCFVGRSGESTFAWFRSQVDGMDVPTTLQHDSLDIDEDWARGWWVKEIPMEPNVTRCVRVCYVEGPGSFFAARAYDDTSDTVIRDSSFDYTLWSGASWHGPIGTADLVVTLMEPDEMLLYAMEPDPVSRSANEIRWHFSNVEPGSGDAPGNIRLEWRRRTRDPE